MERFLPGQLLLSGVPGPELDPEAVALFREVQPGGFILFTRNIKSPAQLRKLMDDLRDLSAVEPILTIDQEGGRVSRLREIGNEPPNAVQLRTKGNRALVRRHGHITGRLLRLFGFNLNLCPVLDLSFDDQADNSLRGRTYGTTVEQVIDLAGAFNEGLRAEGVASCGKHFPGYAAAPLDPHHELPVIARSREELGTEELAIFRHFTGEVDSMMVAHALYPALDDSGTPASLSPEIINGLLRGQMCFGGLVMTDDLDMGAILNHYRFDEAIGRAIMAGNDLAMVCHRVTMIREARDVIARLPNDPLERALARIAEFKKHMAPPDAFSEEEFRRRDEEVWRLRVETLGEGEARMWSPEDGKRSPVELY